jgi:uncharacterized protein (DUF2141 family)
MFATALALMLSVTPAPPPAPPPAGNQATLAFAIEGVRNDKGQLLVAVYTSKEAWLKVPSAAKVMKVAPRAGNVFAVMEEVPTGACAVLVFHDENGNGKLDMGWLPLPGPTEGSGASNGATGRMGPPSWEDAKFECRPGEAVVKLKLAY